MNYATYTFSATDTFEGVAHKYNIPVETLASANNIYGNIPKYISNAPQLANSSTIIIPLVGNGGSTVTSATYQTVGMLDVSSSSYALSSSKLTGSGGSVILIINGEVLYMPCYPKSISDSLSVQHGSQSLFTSTEPYVVYNSSGPRTVSVSFQFHREMRGYDNDTYIDNIIDTIEAACYPLNDGTMSVETRLIIGKDISIRGVITGGVSVSYSGPIIDGKYNVIDINFTIQEVYGANISYGVKKSFGGRVTV